jgi:hypothetical protein
VAAAVAVVVALLGGDPEVGRARVEKDLEVGAGRPELEVAKVANVVRFDGQALGVVRGDFCASVNLSVQGDRDGVLPLALVTSLDKAFASLVLSKPAPASSAAVVAFKAFTPAARKVLAASCASLPLMPNMPAARFVLVEAGCCAAM